MSKTALRYWGVAAASFVLSLTLGGWLWARHEMQRPHAAWSGEAAVVILEPGLDAGSVLDLLGRGGVLRHPLLVRLHLGLRGGAERLQAGEYRFDQPVSPLELLERLQLGDVWLHPVTLPEGLMLTEIVARLEEAGFGEATEFRRAFAQTELVRELDPVAEDLEGYLFPDTYHFPRGESPSRIAEAMVRRFREVVGPSFAGQAQQVGLDLRGAVVLASLIERETGLAGERARISRVFHNRLERGMRLECDPTVIYALARAGRAVERLSRDDLGFDSPWNTYRVRGLPAGPIANPGRESLQAAVRPAEGDELYFVAAPEGGHRFSRTLEQHLEAVREWRRYGRSSR